MSLRCVIASVCLVLLSTAACQPAKKKENETTEEQRQASAVPAASPPSARSQTEVVTCSYPVRRGDTAGSLRARYGEDARIETLGGPEGMDFQGLALWPDSPSRRLEVIFEREDASGDVTGLRLWDKTEWRVAGLQLGDPLASVREANGGPFKLWGFSWDYGGYVNDLLDGRLASLPGGCHLSVRLDIPENVVVPLEILGEGSISSEDARVRKAGPRVTELTLGFPKT